MSAGEARCEEGVDSCEYEHLSPVLHVFLTKKVQGVLAFLALASSSDSLLEPLEWELVEFLRSLFPLPLPPPFPLGLCDLSLVFAF